MDATDEYGIKPEYVERLQAERDEARELVSKWLHAFDTQWGMPASLADETRAALERWGNNG